MTLGLWNPRGTFRFLLCLLAAAFPAPGRGETDPWQTRREAGLTVAYRAGQEKLAHDALAVARQTMARVGAELNASPGRPLTLVLHPTRTEFAQATGFKRREFVVGVAGGLGETAHVDASGGLAHIGTVVAHEMAHLLLTQAVGNAHVPRWFSEGYAERASGALPWAARERLTERLGAHQLFALAQLDHDFPHDGEPATIAYAQSHAFVTYILEHSPEDAPARLVGRLRSGVDFATALTEATGRNPDAWDHAWKRDFQKRFRWYPWIAFGAGASGILMALFCVLAYRAIRRKKEELPDW